MMSPVERVADPASGTCSFQALAVIPPTVETERETLNVITPVLLTGRAGGPAAGSTDAKPILTTVPLLNVTAIARQPSELEPVVSIVLGVVLGAPDASKITRCPIIESDSFAKSIGKLLALARESAPMRVGTPTNVKGEPEIVTSAMLYHYTDAGH